MTDGGCLPNAPGARDASPTLHRALDAAVVAYDRERQGMGLAPLEPLRLAALRPLIAASVEAYMDVVCGVKLP